MGVSVEIVCARAEEAVAAEHAGADRIELVSSISTGGLTPSLGAAQRSLNSVQIPVVPILRPREGGFCYSNSEFETMQLDLERFATIGIKEVSVGILLKDGRIDQARLSRLRQAVPDVAFMCHRAFDLTPDPKEALETLIKLGFSRILTGGRKRSAIDGIDNLSELVTMSEGRIEIVAAGGVRSVNVRRIVKKSKVTSVHLGPTTSTLDPTSKLETDVTYGGHLQLDVQEVAAVVSTLSRE
ncbi:MAG: hypothetical protein KF784_14120 [Fimbriimonadaceae bacterium]|nr:hypothetical protein [Fimbriimonadaceae bacterium]